MAVTTIQCPHCTKPVVVPEPSVPAGLSDICARFPQLCHQVSRLEATVTEVAEAMNRHPKPTVEFVRDMWLNCPSCRGDFNKLLIEHPELFEPKGEGDKYFFERSEYGT